MLDVRRPAVGKRLRSGVREADDCVRWRLLSPTEIRIARFGDEALVFNPSSWQTHLFNQTALDALEALQVPRSIDELAQEVFAIDHSSSAEDREEARSMLNSLLSELKMLGLAMDSGVRDAPG